MLNIDTQVMSDSKKWKSDYLFVKDENIRTSFMFLMDCYGYSVKSKFFNYMVCMFTDYRENIKLLKAENCRLTKELAIIKNLGI